MSNIFQETLENLRKIETELSDNEHRIRDYVDNNLSQNERSALIALFSKCRNIVEFDDILEEDILNNPYEDNI